MHPVGWSISMAELTAHITPLESWRWIRFPAVNTEARPPCMKLTPMYGAQLIAANVFLLSVS